MMADHEGCSFCPRTADQHKAAESAGEVQHRFSSTGQLVQIDRTSPSSQSQPLGGQSVIVAPAPDIALRRLLVSLGVISEDQYEALFTGKWSG